MTGLEQLSRERARPRGLLRFPRQRSFSVSDRELDEIHKRMRDQIPGDADPAGHTPT